MTKFTYDILNYNIFANIDQRDGTIHGHRLILTKEQLQAIEDIITSEPVKVIDDYEYRAELIG